MGTDRLIFIGNTPYLLAGAPRFLIEDRTSVDDFIRATKGLEGWTAAALKLLQQTKANEVFTERLAASYTKKMRAFEQQVMCVNDAVISVHRGSTKLTAEQLEICNSLYDIRNAGNTLLNYSRRLQSNLRVTL